MGGGFASSVFAVFLVANNNVSSITLGEELSAYRESILSDLCWLLSRVRVAFPMERGRAPVPSWSQA